MIVQNTKYIRDLSFEDYLKMPGTSFSSLKNEIIIPSDGMKLGTRVHNYLLEPASFDWQQVDIVKKIAAVLRKFLGDCLKFLEKEISFTAEFLHEGMVLLYKGRADMLRIGNIVIDLKILGGSLKDAIARFGYENQVSGYCIASHCPMGLIVAYNKKTCEVETKIVKPSPHFWEYNTVSKGVPMFKYKKIA